MNERIRELIRKLDNEIGRYYWTDEEKEKFAELIVRECADVAGCNGHVSGFTLGDLMKQHFGVEQ